jgi:hypothetical protein
MGRLENPDSFISRYWGDVVGLFLIGGGAVLQLVVWIVIVILMVKGFDSDKLLHLSMGVTGLGNALTMTGVGIIKLKHNPPTNGGGNGNNVQSSTPPSVPKPE